MQLLLITDIHLDLSGACHRRYGKIGSLYCDTTPQLYELFLSAVHYLNYTHCIYLGDTPAHGYGANFALIKRVFEDLGCQGYALGNNDAAENYRFSSERLRQFYELDSGFFDTGLHYVPLFAPGLEYIGLNSVQFRQQGLDYLDFLEMRLKECEKAGKQLIIGTHIPVGSNSLLNEYWNRSIADRYLSLLQRYEKVVLAEFTGHFHYEYWRYYGNIPGFVNPGLSPSNGGYPGFRVYSIGHGDSGYKILDYEQFYADLEAYPASFYRQYSFSDLRPYLLDDVLEITGETLKTLAVQAVYDPEFNRWRAMNRAMLAQQDLDKLIDAIL